MKTLVLITFTLFAWTASANSIIAKYDFGSAEGFSNSGKFVRSTLSESGDLTIEVYSDKLGQDSVARPAAEQMIVAQISDKNLEMISRLARPLVDEKIVQKLNGIICMLMPSQFMMSDHLYLNRGYDHNTEEFTGQLALVLGPEGCWVSNKTHLENEWANKSARQIKSYLEILVNEHAGHLL